MKIKQNDWSLKGKKSIWIVLILLSALSVLEVYSASSNMTYATGKYWMPMVTHSTYVALGLLAAYGIHRLEIVHIKLGLFVLYLVSLILLPIAALGPKVNDAGRWLHIGSITIQPSEFAKMATVGVVSFLFAVGYRKKLKSVGKGWFFSAMALTLLPAIFIFTENFSTALILCFVMLLLAGTAHPPKKLYWGLCFAIFAICTSGFMFMKNVSEETAVTISEKTPLHRFNAWSKRVKQGDDLPADPKKYNVHENVQVTHSRIAISTSGLTGLGLGNSVERDFLPQAYSDFIYAIIIEEGGLIVGIFVMVLYLILLYSCLKIAGDCKTRYARYLVTGLALMLVTQAMMNMAVAVGAMPVTGQPLPLMSKGGTSMIITGTYIGIILCVSKTVERRKEKEKLEQLNTENEQ